GADVVARRTAGDKDQLLRVQRPARGIEDAEKQIRIVQPRERPVRKKAAAPFEPGEAAAELPVPAAALHFPRARDGGYLFKPEAPPDCELRQLPRRKASRAREPPGAAFRRGCELRLRLRLADGREGKKRHAAHLLKDGQPAPAAHEAAKRALDA